MKNKFLFILALLMLLTVTAGCDLSAVLHIFQDQDGTVDISQYTGYAYKQLDQQEQNIYRQLAVAIDEQQQQIEDVPEDMSAAEFTDIVQAVLADFPGYFWYAGEGTLFTKKTFFLRQRCYDLQYTYDLSERRTRQRQIDNVVDQFLVSLPSMITDYEIAVAAYEYIVENTDYNLDSLDNQNICSVFINGVSVCSGYAKAYQYLLQNCGVEAVYVTGTILDSGEKHAWSIINLDGDYYYVDPTFGDPVFTGDDAVAGGVFYDYFCIGSDELALTHKLNDNGIWPNCVSDKYNYYRYNNILFDDYERQLLSDLIQIQATKRDPIISCKFTSAASYKRAVADLFVDSGIFEMLHDARLNGASFLSGETMYYSFDEQKKIIHIYPQYQ